MQVIVAAVSNLERNTSRFFEGQQSISGVTFYPNMRPTCSKPKIKLFNSASMTELGLRLEAEHHKIEPSRKIPPQAPISSTKEPSKFILIYMVILKYWLVMVKLFIAPPSLNYSCLRFVHDY